MTRGLLGQSPYSREIHTLTHTCACFLVVKERKNRNKERERERERVCVCVCYKFHNATLVTPSRCHLKYYYGKIKNEFMFNSIVSGESFHNSIFNKTFLQQLLEYLPKKKIVNIISLENFKLEYFSLILFVAGIFFLFVRFKDSSAWILILLKSRQPVVFVTYLP